MTERKGNLDDSRRVIKIESDLHQAIDIESAHTRRPMYTLMREAWDAYLAAKGKQVPREPHRGDSIEAGLSPKQTKLLRRYADLLRSGKDPEFARIIELMLDRSEINQQKEHKEESRKAG